VALFNRRHLHVRRSPHGGFEIFELEPQQDAVTVRTKFWISEWSMFVLHIPSMQLQDELTASHKPLIFITPMSAGAAKQLLIPGAAGRDIVNANEGRQLHVESSDVA
jgi:hypothetical protein